MKGRRAEESDCKGCVGNILTMLEGPDLGTVMKKNNVKFNFFDCPECGRRYRALQVIHSDGLEHHWDCPQCSEKRRAYEEAHVQMLRNDPAVLLREKMIDARIPARYLDYSFGNFPVQEGTYEAHQGALNFLCGKYLSLVLLGPTGLGKTSLAISVVRLAVQKGMTALFCKEAALLDEIKSTFSGGRESSQDVIRRFSKYDLLVIDEVGLSDWSLFDAATMTTIIDNRSANNLKTVFLGNLTTDQYAKHFNDQCISRLHQDADFYILSGKDMRYSD